MRGKSIFKEFIRIKYINYIINILNKVKWKFIESDPQAVGRD